MNESDCESEIYVAANLLDSSKNSIENLLELMADCKDKLERLPENCTEALSKSATEIFHNLKNYDWLEEEKFKLLVMELVNRKHFSAVDLLINSLKSENLRSKEDYVELLGQLKETSAIPALIFSIENDKTSGDDEGYVRSKAITALSPIANPEVIKTVIPFLDDVAWRVRGAAAKLLVKNGEAEIGDLFIKRLPLEDDPVNLDILLDGLVNWKRKDSIHLLKEMIERGDFNQNEDMHLSVTDAIEKLKKN